MFGIPDEITDMTRSLKMVEREILIWKMVFRQRNGFGVVRVFFGVPRGYRNPPGKYWAYMGHRGERRQPTRGGRAPLPRGV